MLQHFHSIRPNGFWNMSECSLRVNEVYLFYCNFERVLGRFISNRWCVCISTQHIHIMHTDKYPNNIICTLAKHQHWAFEMYHCLTAAFCWWLFSLCFKMEVVFNFTMRYLDSSTWSRQIKVNNAKCSLFQPIDWLLVDDWWLVNDGRFGQGSIGRFLLSLNSSHNLL